MDIHEDNNTHRNMTLIGRRWGYLGSGKSDAKWGGGMEYSDPSWIVSKIVSFECFELEHTFLWWLIRIPTVVFKQLHESANSMQVILLESFVEELFWGWLNFLEIACFGHIWEACMFMSKLGLSTCYLSLIWLFHSHPLVN